MNGSPSYGGVFDLDQKEREIAEYEAQSQAPGFWDDNVAAQKTMREINTRKEWVDSWSEAHTRAEDLAGLIEIAEEEKDSSMEPDVERELGCLPAMSKGSSSGTCSPIRTMSATRS
jgi:peptide chain release factor 2